MEARIEGSELVGRDAELAIVGRFLALLETGAAGLVVRGEAGIGKTSIWSRAIALASEASARVLTARPVEAELALGYAALGDLLHEAADELIRALPAPQAQALSAALSLAPDPEPGNPLLVGRATLSALRMLASDSAVVVAIDDVQWLDQPSARALAFAARRLGDAPVGFAVSLRDGHQDPVQVSAALAERAVEIRLAGLSLGATGHLVRTRVARAIPHRRMRSLHELAGGNPFFVLELARATRDGDALPPSLGGLVQRRLEEARAGRSAIELLAVLGPMPLGAFPDATAIDAAVTDGVLVERDGEVRFSHPLLAAGAYERIPPGRRRDLHRRAAATAGGIEQRARHLALAATGPDAAVAQTLDEAARSARARGAPEMAAELAAHAYRLTPPDDDDGRSRRMMDEAEYRFMAADEAGARDLAERVLSDGARGAARVRALLLRALTTLDPHAAVATLEAAVAEAHDDRSLAARAQTQLAWQRGAWLGDVEPAVGEALEAVAQAEALDEPSTLVSALTTAGLVLSLSDQPGAAEHFRRALEITDRSPIAAGDRMPRVAYAAERWWRGDYATAEALLADARRVIEEHGDEGILMRLNQMTADFEMRRGHWDEASRLMEEALTDAVDYWRIRTLVDRATLRARRGDPRALEDAEEVAASRAAQTDPLMSAAADFAVGLLDHAAGRIGQAADRVARLASPAALAGSRAAEFAVTIPEVVAIFVEAGRLEEAESLGHALSRRTNQLAPWGDAAAALCLGLVAHAAGRLDEALERLAAAHDGFTSLGSPWELGQTLLAEGSLLRRLGRRRDAAARLDEAIAIFNRLGAKPAASRAEEELRRARPRRRHDDSLTAAETRVARLVAQGLTNREIASQQFTTVATVEAHLTRIYSKLGMRSRTDLARRVSDGSLRFDGDG
jgi:DNA-binding CsgD family transcriptional regulator